LKGLGLLLTLKHLFTQNLCLGIEGEVGRSECHRSQALPT
jgi:hypothetical protein